MWPQVPPADPAAANNILMRALGLVGTPYRFGGNTPETGFDCSGLVTYVYKDVLALPRTSRELAAIQGPRIPPERLATGDLVFFGSGGSVTHVAFMSVKVASSMPPPPAVRSAWIFLMELTGATTIQVQSGFCTEMSLSS